MLLSSRSKLFNVGGIAVMVLPCAWANHSNAQRQTSSISWSTCPDSATTQCAFFDVPRDYSDPSSNDTVSILMRKLPATVSAEKRLGSLLTNPGGPGGSGSAYILQVGQDISTLLEGRYDIIGFDPRGVNLTGPWAACFEAESKMLHLEYQQDLLGVPYPHSTLSNDRAFVNKLSALQSSHNAGCVKNGNRKMLESVGTASVAQDMVRMVEALGDDGLNYLGYSYGTILGATFAAMRPDLVKRMVLDGVSNADSYFNDILKWGKEGMAETHKTLTGFLSTCAEAGPKYCAFAVSPSNSSATQTTETLRKRLADIYTRLASAPIVVADSGAGPGIFTPSDLQKFMLGVLYSPRSWSLAMQIISQIEQGDASTAYSALYSSYANLSPQSYINPVFNRPMQRESLRPIVCGDSAAMNMSIDAYTDYFLEVGKISPVGEHWAKTIGSCRGWSFRANQRYTGPWTATEGLKKTRFPILFMSQEADPVTPLSSAVAMGRNFGNESAVLLVQQGLGHCTTSHPSLCTHKNMRDYFVDGKVPANGTQCTPEPGFIYPTNGTSSKRAVFTYNKREDKILDALERLGEARAKFDQMV